MLERQVMKGWMVIFIINMWEVMQECIIPEILLN
jgi:hypothetical protein